MGAGTSSHHHVFSVQLLFQQSCFFRSSFSEELLYKKSYFFGAPTFHSSCFSEEIPFQKRHFFTASLPFHSYTPYLSFIVSTKIVTYPLATPFFNLASVLLNLFMNQVSNVGYVLLNTYQSSY